MIYIKDLQPFLDKLVRNHRASPDDVQGMTAVFGDEKEDYITACKLMDAGYSCHRAMIKTVKGK
jgi:hypothetical protein